MPVRAFAQIALTWPVACTVGETCEIQHYVDHGFGAGASAVDYTCGTITYKGHNGTDIRLLTTTAEQAGVAVLAAADGRVLRARDTMADVSVRSTGRNTVRDRECGNGLVVAHADGFETQYCHMAKGSLVVKAGDTVMAGQKLGRVGLSGDTEFPHLHITVRHDGKDIDPFAYGEPEGACSGGVSLWAAQLQSALAYRAGVILNAGFTSAQVTMDDIENDAGRSPLTPDAPAVIAFGRAIGLRKGDIQRIVLSGPHGTLAAQSATPLDTNKDQVFFELGRKKPVLGWDPGEYKAAYSVLREGKAVMERVFTTRIGP